MFNIKSFRVKNLIFILILVFFISSCSLKKSKTDPAPPIAPTFFSFVDAEGNDLLNPLNPMAYNFNMPEFYGFKLFYLKNGIKEEAVSKFSGRPYNLMPNCNDGPPCILGVVLSESDTNILELVNTNFNFSDTICKEDNGQIILYNGKVVWDASKDEPIISITIIK